MDGIKVLDVGSMYAGPVVATFLADLGADVIKVEPPGGDALRHFAFSWPMEGRGKRSVTIDMRSPAGRDLVKKLAEDADIIVENHTVGTMERLGLGPDVLQAINPRLVYVRATGYGQTGPYADRRAMDPIGLAFGGISHLLRNADGVPQLTGNLFIADYATALVGALGATEAVRRRDAVPDGQGKGEVVDVSMYDLLARITGSEVINHTLAVSQGKTSTELATRPAPWGPFKASDGVWVMICVVPYIGMWPKFVDALDADWARGEDGKAVDALQYGQIDLVNEHVAQWAAERTADEIVDLLSATNIPAAKCMTPALLIEDEHLTAKGVYEDHVTKDGVAFKMPGPIPQIGPERRTTSRPAPEVGEHTEEVLSGQLGLSAETLADLKANGII